MVFRGATGMIRFSVAPDQRVKVALDANETPLGQNQFTENNLINDCIDVDIVLKESNNSLTRNHDFLETFSENTDTSFNDMLHNNVQCVTANGAKSGLHDAVE